MQRKLYTPDLLRAFLLALILSSFLVELEIRPARAQGQSGITSPATGSSVGGAISILGTAVIEPFQKYELHFKQEPSSNDAYIYFTGGTEPVINGQLGVLQADSLAPGVYSIRLRVVKNDGNYAEFFAQDISIGLEATPTPTPDETPDESAEPTFTPIPTATFTPAPQPTAVVGQVAQPQVGDAIPVNTATPATVAIEAQPVQGSEIAANTASEVAANIPAAEDVAPATETNSITRELGEALSIQRLREQFFYGMRLSAALFTIIALLFLGKWVLSWMRTQA